MLKLGGFPPPTHSFIERRNKYVRKKPTYIQFFADLGEKIPLIGRDSIIPILRYKGPSEPKDLKPKVNPDGIKIPDTQSDNENKK